MNNIQSARDSLKEEIKILCDNMMSNIKKIRDTEISIFVTGDSYRDGC